MPGAVVIQSCCRWHLITPPRKSITASALSITKLAFSITKTGGHPLDDQKIYLRSKYILTINRVTVTVTVTLDCPWDSPIECPWTVRRTVRGQAIFHIRISGFAFYVFGNPHFSRHPIFSGKTGCIGAFPRTFRGFIFGLSTDCPQDCPWNVRRTKCTLQMRGLFLRTFRWTVRIFVHGFFAESPWNVHGFSTDIPQDIWHNKWAAACSYRPWRKANLRPTHTKSFRK